MAEVDYDKGGGVKLAAFAFVATVEINSNSPRSASPNRQPLVLIFFD